MSSGIEVKDVRPGMMFVSMCGEFTYLVVSVESDKKYIDINYVHVWRSVNGTVHTGLASSSYKRGMYDVIFREWIIFQ